MPGPLKQHSPRRPLARSETNEQVRRRQSRRFLPTNSAQWRKIRKAVLERNPLCRDCGAPANEVDHVDGNTANNLPDNLDALCKPCHSARTWKQNREQLTRRDTRAPLNTHDRKHDSDA